MYSLRAALIATQMDGCIPLHLAAWGGSLKVARTLVQLNSSPAHIDRVRLKIACASPPLQDSCDIPHCASLWFFLIVQSFGDWSKRHHLAVVPFLFSEDARPNFVVGTSAYAATDFVMRVRTPLIFTSFPQRMGGTPLYVAASRGHADVVRLLLDAGAKLDQAPVCT